MLFCPALSQFTEHSPRRHDNGRVRAQTARLWPYTWVAAGVRVLNGRMPGDLSNSVQFQTREDGKSCTSVKFLTTREAARYIILVVYVCMYVCLSVCMSVGR